jgi:hypothetical protein
MKIVNHKLLKEFARPGYCELCGKLCPVREGHHLQRRGHGGGFRLDVRINLISLGSSLLLPSGRCKVYCSCHRLVEAHLIEPARVVAVVALREGVTVENLGEVMRWFRRRIKPSYRRGQGSWHSAS